MDGCRVPVLLVGSGQDRLLPSLTEQTRLQRLLPNARRLVLPDSGHTALLEVHPRQLPSPVPKPPTHPPHTAMLEFISNLALVTCVVLGPETACFWVQGLMW